MRSVLPILVALLLGLLVGLLLNALWTQAVWSRLGVIEPDKFLAAADSRINRPTALAHAARFAVDLNAFIGDLFVRLLRLAAVPIVLFSIVAGVASLGNVRAVGRIGVKTLALYLATTVFAVSLGLVIADVVRPGAFIDEQHREQLLEARAAEAESRAAQTSAIPSIRDQLLNIVPRNPFDALARGDMLQVILFAVLLGFGLTLLPDERVKPVRDLFETLGEAVARLVHVLMRIAPIPVFCLIVPVIAAIGLDALAALTAYIACVLAGLAFILFVEYSLLVRLLAKRSPIEFFRALSPALTVAFSSSSSNATLPVTMRCVVDNLKVDRKTAGFVLPLGATVNMDGTALYQAIATIFIAQAFGIDLSFEAQLSVVIAATLASIGSPGIPGGGIVFLIVILQTVGVPAQGIALILGVDRLLDMCRTVVNVTGDAAVAAIVDRSESRRT
jgi:proton glutamate symport protein